MHLTMHTSVFVVNRSTGEYSRILLHTISESTWADHDIVTNVEEAQKLSQRYKLIADINEALKNVANEKLGKVHALAIGLAT